MDDALLSTGQSVTEALQSTTQTVADALQTTSQSVTEALENNSSAVNNALYTTNDRYMGPYPAQWFDAFRGAGGVGKYHALPAFGQDGHQLFARGLARWKPLAEQALRDAGFEPRPLNRPAAANAARR